MCLTGVVHTPIKHQAGLASLTPPKKLFTFFAGNNFEQDVCSVVDKDLSDKSKRAYGGYLKLIEAKFGSMPIGALEDKRVRGDFKEFRDSFFDTPRKADYVWTTIARVLSVAKDRGSWPVS